MFDDLVKYPDRLRCFVAIEGISIKVVIPANNLKVTGAGIQKQLIFLDSPVSSTGQAQSRAPLARNDKKVITTQSVRGNDRM